jgi:hypothetical protein
LKILRQYIVGDKKVTEYTKDGVTVSHTVEEAIGKADIPEHVSPFAALQEENKALKERLSLVESAVDDIIFGGNF